MEEADKFYSNKIKTNYSWQELREEKAEAMELDALTYAVNWHYIRFSCTDIEENFKANRNILVNIYH